MEVREPSAKYLARPGYRQTEVGVIPGDWKVHPIRAVCKLINGRGFKPFEWKKAGFPIIRIQNLNGSDEFNYFQGTYDKKLEVEPGQLLFAWSGSRGTSFGPHIWSGPLGLLNYHTWKVQVRESEVSKEFFLYALRKLTAFIEDRAHGASALVHTQKWEMEGFEFPAPPTQAEQEAIAEALSDADTLIESLEQLLAKKRYLKQGAMQELLTGKKRLSGFGGKWEVKALGDLFTFGGGYTASRDQLSSEGYCYLHYGDIHTSKKAFVDVRSEYQNIPKLDIPLKKVSPVSLLDDGDVVFVDASEDDEGASKHLVVFNPDGIPYISGLHTIVAKSKGNAIDHQYRRYCFQTSAVKAQFRFFAVGTKVSGISKTNIAKITLLVPSVPEQAAIASILSDIDAEIVAIEEKLVKAGNLKQGMMQELLTGRIRLDI
jgi:type I restriction enzyme S subunit